VRSLELYRRSLNGPSQDLAVPTVHAILIFLLLKKTLSTQKNSISGFNISEWTEPFSVIPSPLEAVLEAVNREEHYADWNVPPEPRGVPDCRQEGRGTIQNDMILPGSPSQWPRNFTLFQDGAARTKGKVQGDRGGVLKVVAFFF